MILLTHVLSFKITTFIYVDTVLLSDNACTPSKLLRKFTTNPSGWLMLELTPSLSFAQWPWLVPFHTVSSVLVKPFRGCLAINSQLMAQFLTIHFLITFSFTVGWKTMTHPDVCIDQNKRHSVIRYWGVKNA